MTFLSSFKANRDVLVVCAVLSAASSGSLYSTVWGQDYLKGTVRQEDYRPQNTGPSLKRGDINRNSDAFGGEPGGAPVSEEIDAPASAFNLPNTQLPAPPPQPRNFPLEANIESVPSFDGLPEQGASDQPPVIIPQQPQTSISPPRSLPPHLQRQEPDSSPEMQLAWDQWHKRVAQAIYERFNAMAQLAFRHSRPMAAYVTYTVTRDGRVVNVQLQQKSPNIAFNTMLLLVVNSISGQKELLAFPQGSRRMSVEKAGMFTQNYGQQGFKFTTGDRETLRHQ